MRRPVRAGSLSRVTLVVVLGTTVLGACSQSSSSDRQTPQESSTQMHGGGHLRLEPAAVMGRPDRIIAGPQGNDGQFLVECELSHMVADDPILFPDEPGASHLHAFFGNETTSASSRPADLLGKETSCDDSRDSAAYWVPVLMDGATPIEPSYAIAYYRAGIDVDPTAVVAYPHGLVMIAGDPLATSEQPLEVVSWSCGHGARKGALPPICPIGADVQLSVTFPDCWDGVNLDVGGHRRHVHYSSKGKCPNTHPVHIPQLVFAVHFPVHGDITHMRLSSGTLGSGHADFVNAWDPARLEHEVDLCIRQQNVCAIASGRRPV